MSLSKQLLILISIIFFIIFSVNTVLSIDNIRSYLEVESEVHVQDTATSLGLSLSPHMDDEQDPIIRTMMNAIFDMGYYQEMRLVNVDGVELVNLSNPVKMEGVPGWFIKLLPMKPAVAVSEISSGWSISGTLYVSSNPAYGYLKLYQQTQATLSYSLLIFIGAVVLLIGALRLTLKPLKDIEKQANQIAEGNFTVIDKLPWTLEVKSVAQTMNSMSRKIGGMITRLNAKLASLSDSLKRDPLTQLFNQRTFNESIRGALSAGQHGHVVYIKFGDLAAIAKDKGNQAVDTLLTDFAKLLSSIDSVETSAYRLYGSEFAMLCLQTNSNSIKAIADELQGEINELASQYDLDELVHMGIVPFERSSELSRLTPAMIEAYEQARIIGSNAYFIKQDTISSMSELEWKSAITSAIDNNTPEITFTAEAYNYDTETPVKVMQEAFTVVRDSNNSALSIGTFFAMAQEFNMVEALDKCIINKIIHLMEQTGETTPVTINLSMSSIASQGFQQWLKARLGETNINPALFAFSITSYAAAKDLNAFANFSIFVKSLGARTLLKRYSSDNIAVDLLKELHIDYIRLSRDLTSDIRSNVSKANFLEIMHEVSSLLDIKVLAEDVKADEDFDVVKNSGIYGISR